MADKELNLPIVNAIDELKASNKDQRERLQKSMRAGLLNVKKSVDALSFSFERSLIDQSHAQERMHDATMAFHEASLEQGKHSGHLFAAKMTAIGAGLVAWFENKLLDEFGELRKSVDEGKVVHHDFTIEEGNYDDVLGKIERHTGITRTYVNTISRTLKDAFGITEQEEARKELNDLFEEQKKWYKISAKKTEETNEILKDSMETPEEKMEAARKEEVSESGDVDSKSFLKKIFKPKENWFTSLLKGLGILGAGVLVFTNWEGIKEGLISIKDFLHDTYIHVSENSDIYKGIATVMGSIWLLSKAWLVSVAVIQGTTAAISAVFKKLALAFKIIKKAFLPLTLIFGAWEAGAKSIEEYEKSGDWKTTAGVFTAEFVKSVVTSPFRLIKSVVSWIAEQFGFKEFSKYLDEIDIGEEYDKLKKLVDDTIYGAFNWVGEKIKAGWKFVTETAPEWIGKKIDELKQVFIDLYDDAIKWIDETFSWDNLKESLGFGDKSVMEDTNVNPSQNLIDNVQQSIENQRQADKFAETLKNRLQGINSSNTPSGNGAGETMMIRGTVDGHSLTAPIVTNAPTSINNQNNTTNNSTIVSPLNTTPSPAFNYIPGDSDLWIAP